MAKEIQRKEVLRNKTGAVTVAVISVLAPIAAIATINRIKKMIKVQFYYEQFENLSLAGKAKVADVYDVAHDFRNDFARMKHEEFATKVGEYLRMVTAEYWEYSLDWREVQAIQNILTMDSN